MGEYGPKLYPRFCRRHQPIQTVTLGCYWGSVCLTQIWGGVVLLASYSSLQPIAGWLTGTYDMNDHGERLLFCFSRVTSMVFINFPVLQGRYLTAKVAQNVSRVHKPCTCMHLYGTIEAKQRGWETPPKEIRKQTSKAMTIYDISIFSAVTLGNNLFRPWPLENSQEHFRAFTGLCKHAEPTTEQIVRLNPPWQIEIS